MAHGFQKIAFCLLFFFITVAPIYGADGAKDPGNKSKIELHEKMASHHKMAADCLKAGGSNETCNKEAMKDCPMMKTGKCPFMDKDMGNMSEMDHDNMMKDKKSQKKK